MPKYIVTVVNETKYEIQADGLAEALHKVEILLDSWDSASYKIGNRSYMQVKEKKNG